MDKSAVNYSDGDKSAIGTNYTKVKPVIDGMKPSNIRAKFENLAKSNEEETRRRAEEQKRLREEKDKFDREEAAKKVIVESKNQTYSEETVDKKVHSATNIVTGRASGVGHAISAFNQMQSPTKVNVRTEACKEPIHIPREHSLITEHLSNAETARTSEEAAKSEKVISPPPDLIPTIEIQNSETVLLEEEVALSILAESDTNNSNQYFPEPLYQNNSEVFLKQDAQEIVPTIPDVSSEAIYANSENLADYIEDTHIYAIALYDYQAADEDEISFDPDDMITHIEKVNLLLLF